MNKFSVYEHLERIEKAYLEILETRQPISQSITLWWGLDGLRLKEDGTTEWISRRKPKAESKPLPTPPIQQLQTQMMQQISPEQLAAYNTRMDLMNSNALLQYQMWQQSQMSSMIGVLQSYRPQWTAYLPGTCVDYTSLTQCCCNWPR